MNEQKPHLMIVPTGLRLSLAGTALMLVAAGVQAAGDDHSAHQGTDGHRHHEASGHEMSADDLATLRRKIPLYRQYSDEQINASMERMTDLEVYVSPAGVRDEIGVLALGHGYNEPGNTFFTNAYGPVSKVHPTAAGLGMAMMSSSHIQQAVDQLEGAGARTIVAIPTEISDDSSLIRQWQYILGVIDESAYLDVPRVESDARIVLTGTPTASPIVGDILVEYAKSASRDPANEAALLVAHGPQSAEDNKKLLEVLAGHAAKIREGTKLAEVKHDSLQDDAPTAIRTANVNRMRDWIEGHTKQGRRVIVLQMIMTGQGGVTQRLHNDFAGLDYDLVDKGLLEHPFFDRWVRETVQAAVASPQEQL